MENEFKRICRNCGKELFYKSRNSFKLSEKINGLCRSCGGIKLKNDNGRQGNLKILLDDSYESFYWMGFILADGCFYKNRLKIGLSPKDKYHLEKFVKYISLKNPIIEKKINVSIQIKDSVTSPMICEKFNINPAKTYNPPLTISKYNIDFQYCLLAGFIDGDGCIQKQYNRYDYKLSIKNHANWINILEEFNELIDGTKNFTRINNSGYAILLISNSEILKNLKKRIESYNLPIMKRKWDIIDYNYQSSVKKSNELKNLVLIELKNGMKPKEIKIKYGISYPNISRIKKLYYEK